MHPEASDERPFFLVGASRSGTTMFRLMLNSHSALSIPGETWFLSDLMDRLPLQEPLSPAQVEEAVSIVRGHWRWREWGLDNDLMAATLQSLDRPRLGRLVDALFSLTIPDSPGVQWGDKTPGYTTEIERLHQVLPRARFIHVIRDGRDVCLSLKKTGWHGEATWTIAEYWGSTITAACRAGRALPADQYMEVSYEELVLDTETVLRSVCRFLEVDFEPGMLSFHETAGENIPGRAEAHLKKTTRPPRESDVQRWRREQAKAQTVIFEAFAGPALELAGYERTARHGLGVIRAGLGGIERAARASLPLRRRLGLHLPGWRKGL